ncbi:HNH endonuclease [Actinomyces ruminicola]|uniref:HNH endonuclease n=1 Tax=Actinomyces ruminicola TaxID=332524 RepID=A0A1H0D729_9ACTO|nr:HNH endonuclease signature motif containing protein [Actinomyces ruminicola]SDN66000.1 HNH endonuclease [Actinomyces ruminicola]
MFEGGGVESRPARGAGAGVIGLPAAERTAARTVAVPAGAAPGPELPAAAGADSESLVERLAGVPAGAGLAGLVEDLLSVLLAPAHPDKAVGADSGGGAGPTDDVVEVADVLGIADTDRLLAAVTSPGERELAQAAGRLGPDWGGATGVDALACLGGEGLSELVGACHRLGAWAAWCEGVAAACLARTPEMNRGVAPWGPGGKPGPFITAEEQRFTTSGEIAARLGATRSSAGCLLDRGNALLQPEFAPTEALHRAGLLDASKTALVIRRLGDAAPEVVVGVQERVLARAPRRTCSQLGRDIDRALAALDPDGAGHRRKRNVAGRHMTRPRQAGEGVHEMRLVLPSLDALLLDATLDAIAASARAAGDERSLGQLRADAITGMTLRTLQGSQNLACRTSPNNGRGGGSDDASGGSDGDGGPRTPTVSGLPTPVVTDGAGGVAGAGVSAAAGTEAAGLLPDGVPLAGLLGALSGLVEPSRPWWTPSGTEPVYPPPGISINVDVTVPLNLLLPDDNRLAAGSPPADGCEDPPTCSGEDLPVSGSTASAARGGSLPTESSGTLPAVGGASLPVGDGRDSAGVPVVPSVPVAPPGSAAPSAEAVPTAEVVIGAGRVAVPAATARALAAGGVWRRLVTDPVSGTVLDVGRSHYRPPAGLRDLVRARDQECAFPGCTVPAFRCDIDHINPWDRGGTTSLDNLASLCQAHHRLKHTPGWTLTRQDPDDGYRDGGGRSGGLGGALVWTTPTGARYRRTPDGTITLLPRRIGPRQLAAPARRVPEELASAVDEAVMTRLQHGLDLAARTPNSPAAAAGRINRPGRPPRITSRGPRPGRPVGAFEPTPYPDALHQLDLTPLLDEIPPF